MITDSTEALKNGSALPRPVEAPELRTELEAARNNLASGNVPQAELHLRRYQRGGGRAAEVPALLEQVHAGYGVAPGFELVEPALAVTERKAMLIKAWGYGFWSDVHHVLSQLLVAELTGRTPLVHWGTNSLFRDGSGANAFTHFFEPVSRLTLASVADETSVYPAKWRGRLDAEDLAKWEGPDSRRAAPYFFRRDETLVVCDFYTPVNSIIPWIGASSRWHGLSEDEIYAELFRKYLRPVPTVLGKVEAFYRAHMDGRRWVAVHMRGSDKIHESAHLHEVNRQYLAFVDRIIELNPTIGVFLLTDSMELHASFSTRYGDRVVTTPALRSGTEAGVHLQGHDGRTVGEEVLVDALLATRCDYFVGNMESNVSLAIASLKPWAKGLIVMLGAKSCRSENLFLHRRQPAPDAAPPPDIAQANACRLCRAPAQSMFALDLLGGRHRTGYFRCSGCGSLQTERPHWLGEAYGTGAERFDTGKASRTLVNFLALPRLMEILRVRPDDACIDFGGGTGLLARLLRDAGYNFHSFDKYGNGEFAGEYKLDSIARRCSVVTIFEVVEHFAEPAREWEALFASDPEFVIGSTSFYEGQGPDWGYLAPESGQHVFFYSPAAIEHLARQHGRHAYQIGMYFLLSRQVLTPDRLAALQAWSVGLYDACKGTFERWAQGPYAHATRDNQEVTVLDRLRRSGTRIAVDGVFFRFSSGIARVWKSVLAEWSASGFGELVVVIDRARTAPRFPGIHYVDAPQHQYADIEADRRLLQQICDRERVSVFISTYYTSPVTTPATMLVHDMIPEAMGFDLNDPQWREKRRCIEYAHSYLSVSESTTRDLLRFFPQIDPARVVTTHCGSDFSTPSPRQVASFRERHGITRPYFLTSGSRADYKNALLFFKAFEQLGPDRADWAIVCTHAHDLEPELATCLGPAQLHTLVLDDADLQCAYAGAMALAYPSRYEGFGLPVLEAMACSCPVITCAVSSIPEVGGDAVRYVDPNDVNDLLAALRSIQDPATRASMIERGLERARRFSWARMARDIAHALAVRAVELPASPVATQPRVVTEAARVRHQPEVAVGEAVASAAQ